jgi:flagellar protein FliO/FliZ
MEAMDWGQYIGSLFVIIAMILALAYLVKRVGLAAKIKHTTSLNGHMEVMDTLYLDPRRRILLVRCRDQEHMVLVAGEQTQYLSAVSAVEEQA